MSDIHADRYMQETIWNKTLFRIISSPSVYQAVVIQFVAKIVCVAMK